MAANKYVNSKVYKLQHEDGHYYIGSTTQDLCKRLQDHKNASKRDKYKNIRIYDYIKNDGWEMVNIILIEKFELKDRSELLREEDRHIRLHRDDELCLNIRRALTTGDEKKEQMKEYYEQNKNKRKEQMKEYYEQNKDKLKEQIQCVCGGQYTLCHKSSHLKTKKHQQYIRTNEIP